MAYVVTKISGHGTSNPIVARLSVQSRELMGPFNLTQEKKKEIWSILFDKVQSQLLICYDLWTEISTREIEIISKVEKGGIETQSHGIGASIDTIERLDQSAHSFLYSAKSALRDVKSMICEFFVNSKRKRKELEDGNYNNLMKWAEGRFGISDPLTKLIEENLAVWIAEVYLRRNAVEHPGGDSGKLNVFNFTAIREEDTGKWKGVLPGWSRNHNPPTQITFDMAVILENILCFAEDMLVLGLLKAGSMVPVIFLEIKEEDRDENCPIRLRVTIDRDKLESQQGTPEDTDKSR